MQAAGRPHVIGGVALAGASLIAVTPIASPPDPHLSTAVVRLASTGFALPDLSGLTSDLGSLGGLGGLDLGGIQNIPYNLFADVVNIPYYESLALQEYASALGPPGNDMGVPGWVPPGAPGFGTDAVYTDGGTGSWYTETLGNTWGWDDGNWPQVDGLLHFALPFSFTEDIANQAQTFAQSEFIDGAVQGCEFECANPVGYFAEWLHGGTPLQSLLDGTTFPTTFPTTIQGDVGTPYLDTIWSGQPGAHLNPLSPFEAIAGNLTGAPQAIQLPDLANVVASAEQVAQNDLMDFNPYVTGSYVYWGAPTLYSVPAAIGGTIQEFTGIPNQFGFPADQALGSEPATGPTEGPLSLLTGLPQGIEYLFTGTGQPVDEVAATGGDGLLGYLNPGTYITAFENLASGDLPHIFDQLPGLGYLGVGNPGDLLGSFDATPGLTSTFDPASLLTSFDPSSLLAALDPSTLATDFGSGATSMLPDLALNLFTSIF